MTPKIKREVVSALVRAGRHDLARQLIGAGAKVIKEPPEIAKNDPNLMDFFKPLIGRARLGFDDRTSAGGLDFGRWGDIGFYVGDENIYIWLGDASMTSGSQSFNYMFKNGKAAAEVVLSLLAVQKKADKLSG